MSLWPDSETYILTLESALHIWRLEINIICPPQYDIRRLDHKIRLEDKHS